MNLCEVDGDVEDEQNPLKTNVLIYLKASQNAHRAQKMHTVGLSLENNPCLLLLKFMVPDKMNYR